MTTLYSIRMRASRAGRHLSGAERIAAPEALPQLAAALVERALTHPRGRAAALSLQLEELTGTIRRGRLPTLRTVQLAGVEAGRAAASALLVAAGVAPQAVAAALAALIAGPAPGGQSMRGAMLIDAVSGARREADPARGVRASRMDLTPAAERELRAGLAALGLDRPQVREALVLAGKVLAAPGVLAELCWSDDPDYTAGYVATPGYGYVRFPQLKPFGEERGGRAIFVAPGTELAALSDFLQQTPLLFEALGPLHPASDWPDDLEAWR